MSTSSSTFDRLLKGLSDVAAGFAAFGILVVVLLQVSSRLLDMSVAWTEEATRYLFVWMIFLGLAAGFRTVESARVVVLLAMFPRAIHRLSVPIYVLSSVSFFVLMGWTGYKLVWQQYVMNETAATLAIPMWLIGTIMPLTAILSVLGIIDSLKRRRHLIEIFEPEVQMPELRHQNQASSSAEKLS
ncbi:TRAP transporter small permease [Agrobacterium tumefaciens]|uniref:TRAP transporter small permease n=1 Tax=Agrobacterium tumefaciens TaxID=358 RepID=UPI00287D3183|nr:TRAP transporter small permease [Agrobacterium tumefaciens]MDS7595718.1 TRAP transporter small permease [Agrobacterium tumefaciens]